MKSDRFQANREIEYVQEQVVPQGTSRHALVIGVEAYQDERLNTLRCVCNDAQKMAELLKDPEIGAVPEENLTILVNENATYQGVRKGLASLVQRAGEEDTVFLYYAGHGGLQGDAAYWLVHDTDVENLLGSGFANRDIEYFLNQLAAKRVITFLDCCYAAAMDHQQNPTRKQVDVESILASFTGEGRLTISSSDGNQPSVELSSKGHGAFTYHLLQGLRGEADSEQDGVVDAHELWGYLNKRVAASARRAGNPQRPRFHGSVTHKFALTLNPKVNQHRLEVGRRLRELIHAGVSGVQIEALLGLWEGRIEHGCRSGLCEQIEEWVQGSVSIKGLIRYLEGVAPGLCSLGAEIESPAENESCVVCGLMQTDFRALEAEKKKQDMALRQVRKEKQTSERLIQEKDKHIEKVEATRQDLESKLQAAQKNVSTQEAEIGKLKSTGKKVTAERNDLLSKCKEYEDEISKLRSKGAERESSSKLKGKEADRDGRFIAYTDGTVLDTQTGLMWAAKDNGKNINWINAKKYCEGYRSGGYSDWRMPTIDELKSLHDPKAGNKNNVATRLIELTGNWVWSSETPEGSSAAFFGFFFGGRGVVHRSYVSLTRALPVRAGT